MQGSQIYGECSAGVKGSRATEIGLREVQVRGELEIDRKCIGGA